MAINPNTTFVAGAIYTAAEANRFPRGIMAGVSSSTSYTLTTTMTQTTGMTLSFSAISGRFYKITYYEPQCQTPSSLAGFTNLKIFQTSTAGTQLQQGFVQSSASSNTTGSPTISRVTQFSTGTITIIGAASSSTTTGAPILTRGATFEAQLYVEDIGPA